MNPDQLLIFQIGATEVISLIVAIAGTLISIAWFASGRFVRLETLVESLDRRLTNLEGNAANVFSHNSPISLTEEGKELLEGSGLKEFVDDSKTDLSRMISDDLTEIETAYDVQEAAFEFFDNMQFDFEFEKSLKEYAYESGNSMHVLRRVAGIYFRDVLLQERSELEAKKEREERANL